MRVINVEQNDIINGKPDDSIIFNKETQSYFKKSSTVTLTEDRTFRDAILGEFKPWARWREKDTETDFTKYYDNNDEIKILKVFNELDTIKALKENRLSNINSTTILDTIDETVLSSFNDNKISINIDYLNKFNKLVYVDQINGSDMNLGTKENPVKTIRRAEALIIENTGIIIQPGIYDITEGNLQSNTRYCISGLSGNYDNNSSLTVEYINPNDIGDVKLIVDTQGLDWEARDLTFINGMKNNNSKVIGITFKMVDKHKETAYSVSIARGSEGIQIIDCVFDIDVLNGNIVSNKLKGRDSVVFKNCLINFKKQLTGITYDNPYLGKYELENCFINVDFKTKLESFDSQNKNARNEVSLISNLNTTFF